MDRLRLFQGDIGIAAMQLREFCRGFLQAMQGRPFDDMPGAVPERQLAYELGRIFATEARAAGMRLAQEPDIVDRARRAVLAVAAIWARNANMAVVAIDVAKLLAGVRPREVRS